MTHVQRFLLRLLKDAAPVVIGLLLLSATIYCAAFWPLYTIGTCLVLVALVGLGSWLQEAWKATENNHD